LEIHAIQLQCHPTYSTPLVSSNGASIVREGFLVDLRAQSPGVCMTAAYGNFLPWKYDAVPRGEGWEEIVTNTIHMVVAKPRGDDPEVAIGFGNLRVNLNIGDGMIELQTLFIRIASMTIGLGTHGLYLLHYNFAN
jgi:hypothetical protein